MDDEKAVFLSEGDILPWKIPLASNEVSLLHLDIYNGSTELVGYKGIEDFSRAVPPFFIVASAAKYIADINRLPPGRKTRMGSELGKASREVLFDGSISIYGVGEIPGTTIKGYHLIRNGRIWTARADINRFSGVEGLRELIFEREEPSERVNAIVRGYEIQAKERERARLNARAQRFA